MGRCQSQNLDTYFGRDEGMFLKFPCQINMSFVFGWVGTWGICRGEGFYVGDLRFVAMSLALPCDKSTLAAAMAEEAHRREDQYDFV